MHETPRWEYRVIPIKTRIHSESTDGTIKPVIDDVQNDLNNLGKEGWELVSVQDTALQDGRRFTVAYLKRQNNNRGEIFVATSLWKNNELSNRYQNSNVT